MILCRNPQKTGFPVLLRIREAVDEQNDECDTQQEQHGISSHSVKFFETFVDETSLFGLFQIHGTSINDDIYDLSLSFYIQPFCAINRLPVKG